MKTLAAMFTRLFAAAFFILSLTMLVGCKASKPLASKEGYVHVQGGKLWYRVLGEGPGTPLLCMHGGPGGTCRSFYQLSPIAKDRPLILFDQLGSGRSGYHEDTSLLHVDNFVGQVAALRAALPFKEMYVCGHSWGAALALEYYLKYPQAVKGIIFSSPYISTPRWDADADTLIMRLPNSIQLAIREGESSGKFSTAAYEHADEVFAKNYGLRKKRLSHPLDTFPSKSNGFIYNYMWGPTEFTATGTLKNYDRIRSLSEIKVPVLFITGEYDEARPATVKYFQSLVPNAQFKEISGSGHATFHDNRKETLKAIQSFLNETDKR